MGRQIGLDLLAHELVHVAPQKGQVRQPRQPLVERRSARDGDNVGIAHQRMRPHCRRDRRPAAAHMAMSSSRSAMRAASSWLGPVCSRKAHWLMASARRAASVGVTSFSKSSMMPMESAESSVRSSALRSRCPERRLSSALAVRWRKTRPAGVSVIGRRELSRSSAPSAPARFFICCETAGADRPSSPAVAATDPVLAKRFEHFQSPQRHTFRERGWASGGGFRVSGQGGGRMYHGPMMTERRLASMRSGGGGGHHPSITSSGKRRAVSRMIFASRS